ncbi:MAG: YbhB/YbcL family Raf kinase inhibitor-like protein [Candidatus Peribacteraceae bacterium]|nr:YbhB/YbcL family Raf kinase inhibitor-like protein [Candidatus Peribacteraceae bacterium]
MRTHPLIIIATLAFALVACGTVREDPLEGTVGKMRILSEHFVTNGPIPADVTCDGKDRSPAFTFSKVPEDTKSLVLVSYDPDSPSGLWVHWLIYNIDPTVSEVKEGTVPDSGLQGVTGWGDTSYRGPCPPSGVHRYYFQLYALDTTLPLFDAPPDWATVKKALKGHILERAEIFGRYERKK